MFSHSQQDCASQGTQIPTEMSSKDIPGTATARIPPGIGKIPAGNAPGLGSVADAEFSSPNPKGREQKVKSHHSGAIIFPDFGTGELLAPWVVDFSGISGKLLMEKEKLSQGIRSARRLESHRDQVQELDPHPLGTWDNPDRNWEYW